MAGTVFCWCKIMTGKGTSQTFYFSGTMLVSGQDHLSGLSQTSYMQCNQFWALEHVDFIGVSIMATSKMQDPLKTQDHSRAMI